MGTTHSRSAPGVVAGGAVRHACRAAHRAAREEATQARTSIKEATDFEGASQAHSPQDRTEEAEEVATERSSPTMHKDQRQQYAGGGGGCSGCDGCGG